MSKINTFYSNPSTFIMGQIYILHSRLFQAFSTVWCHFKMRLCGIMFEKGCKLGGYMIFFRAQSSSIKMGKGCRFNSNICFNFRGINHKYILQTISGGTITIGDNCGFSGASIISRCLGRIGNNVLCGANLTIGYRNNYKNIYKEFQPQPVTIGDNVWVGINSMVMR